MTIPLKYNARSLIVRPVTTLMTAGGIALVVVVFVIAMAMVAGLDAAIEDAGSPDNLVVLRRGATTETVSGFTIAQFEALQYLAAIRRTPTGEPYASPELPVQVLLDRTDGVRDNVILRGVRPIALLVHDKVHLVAGRMFKPGLGEVIVGQGLLHRYRHCALGAMLPAGRRTWKVVGIFAAGGGSFESEIWGDLFQVLRDTQRGDYYASVRIKLAPGADADALIRRIADDPRINLQAESEAAYYKDQTVTADRMRSLGTVAALIMAIGAVFAAMNTMYAAISARTTELATLRALGFTGGAVMLSMLAESLLLALAAGLLGIVLALPINGVSTTFANTVTFSTMAFSFRVTPAIIGQGLLFAALMGLLGGWLPAWHAMRMNVVDALRSL
ncbi:MAG TPA: FtsX-like permease family protein [Candidatus Binataceae bacterium]|nr:FtsX-like permease family protein [Candidatus Binataceae bacterium]